MTPNLSRNSAGFCYHLPACSTDATRYDQRTHEPLGGLVRSAHSALPVGGSGRIRVSASAHQGAFAFLNGNHPAKAGPKCDFGVMP